jgi:ribosomal protein S18 acetylase RimI-like enzyme
MNMNLNYRKATIGDIDLLTRTRIEVLRAANGLSDDTDMTEVEHQSYEYYQKALREGTHSAYLVFDGDRFAGAGGISYYQVMPTFHNPSGNKAYIMNMYTRPEYRRQGIARRMLDMLINDAKAKGIRFITLEATRMGRPLYENAGFVPMKDEMILPE